MRPHLYQDRCLQKLGVDRTDEARMVQVCELIRGLFSRGYSVQGACAYIRAHDNLKAQGGLVIARYKVKTTDERVLEERARIVRKTGEEALGFRELEERLKQR